MTRKTAKMSSRGQVTIPKEIREELELSRGDRIEFIQDGEGRYILKKKDPLSEISRELAEEARKKGYTEKDLRERIEEVREELWNELYGELDREK